MRARGWSGWALAAAAIVGAGAAGGCKTLSERYIALEVWKYERCFGHLPPGFVPPGAPVAGGGPPGRVCGQGMPMAAPMGCDECGGGLAGGGMPMGMDGGVPTAAAPTRVTAGRPVLISDELVVP
jgi:hypothetical protein